MSTEILLWIQLIEGALFVLILGSFAVTYAIDVYRNWRWDRGRSGREATRAELAGELNHILHWFGESREAFELIKIIRDNLTNGMGINAPYMRDEWRRNLEEPES